MPFYTLQAAAGAFRKNQGVEALGYLAVPGLSKPDPAHFVAQVLGRSMEPRIADGSYCLFRRYQGGSREGKIVLAQSQGMTDVESGAAFTVKVYRAQRIQEDGQVLREAIVLQPLNKEFEAIRLEPGAEAEAVVLAEFIRTIE